jgi:hypothetical protein
MVEIAARGGQGRVITCPLHTLVCEDRKRNEDAGPADTRDVTVFFALGVSRTDVMVEIARRAAAKDE